MDGARSRCHLPDHHMVASGIDTRINRSQSKLLRRGGQVLVSTKWLGHCTLCAGLFENRSDRPDIGVPREIEALCGGEVDHSLAVEPGRPIGWAIACGCLTGVVGVTRLVDPLDDRGAIGCGVYSIIPIDIIG